MLIEKGDFHASAFILGPNNTTVLIRDKRRPDPLWKFPGGKQQRVRPFGHRKYRDETPIETLIRETEEETGLRIKKRNIDFVTTVDMGRYKKHYFLARMSSYGGLFDESKEYEETRIFELDEIQWLSNFHPVYRHCFFEHIRPILTSPGAEP